MSYEEKYQKYKQKYMQAKYNKMKGGAVSLTVGDAIGIIELWHKFLYSYYIYRARFDNTMPLKDFTALSNLMFRLSQQPKVKAEFNEMYLSDLEQMIKNKQYADALSKERGKLIFTLRQDTTRLIRSLILINDAARAEVEMYLDFLKSGSVPKESDFKELLGKCVQLEGLVSPGETDVIVIGGDRAGLDRIRDLTNLLLKQLGDTYDSTVENMGMRANNLDDKVNRELDKTINLCLREIKYYVDVNLYDLDGIK